RTVSPEAKRNLVERSRPRPRVPRATEGAVNDSTHFNRAPKMGTGVNGTYLPRVTVEDSILNRFGHMYCGDLLDSFQISDGAGHATNFVVRACAEAKLFDRFA
ncbi:MAG: hypothetical protein RIR77_270, partial [Planctomycetota bacterium]